MVRREGGVTNDSSQITDLPAHQKWYNSAYMSFKMFFFVHPPFPVLGHGRKERERDRNRQRDRKRQREREGEREKREREERERERERDGNNNQITDLPAHQKWYSLTCIRFSKFYVVYILLFQSAGEILGPGAATQAASSQRAPASDRTAHAGLHGTGSGCRPHSSSHCHRQFQTQVPLRLLITISPAVCGLPSEG